MTCTQWSLWRKISEQGAELKMNQLALCLTILLLASTAHAQRADSICKLGDTTKLFLAKDGKKYSAKLPKGTKVVLNAEHGERWMVESLDGKIGFIKTKWLERACTFSKPQPKPEAPPAPAPEPIQSSSVVDTAAALELTRLAAEKPSEELEEIVEEQAAVVDKSRTARQDARQNDCADRSDNAYRVAVYDLELVNLPEGIGKIVSNALLGEIRKLEGISAIGMAEIQEMIQFEKTRQVMGCDADEACLAEIAGALGVDELITGQMSEQADGRELIIRRIDQRRAEVVESVTQRLEIGQGEEFLLAIGPSVEKLYPARKNRPGTKRGVPKKLLLRINPPPIDATITWSTMSAAALTLALGGTFAYLGKEQEDLYNQGADQTPGPDNRVEGSPFQEVQQTGDQYFMIATGSLITGATLTLSSVVMSFFTDWEGYGDDDTESEE